MAPSDCPACDGPLRPWMRVPSGEPADSRWFSLSRCSRCGTAVTEGSAPGPEAYEQGVYAPGAPRAAPLVRAAQRAAIGQPARLLARAGVAPGARVLDAGAGRGRLVAQLRARGFDASGIEPSARGVESADAAGLPVERASIEDHEDADLGAVVLWHVAEHLDDPLAAIERAASWLAPGGVLLLGVPNVASAQARIAGPGWMHLDAPRHRVHFTPAGLAALLARCGLESVACDHMVWEHNPAAMWMALLTRFADVSPAYAFHALKRNAAPGRRDAAVSMAALPLLPFAVVVEAAAATAGRGGTVALVARRYRDV